MADHFNPLQQQALQQALRRQQVRPQPSSRPTVRADLPGEGEYQVEPTRTAPPRAAPAAAGRLRPRTLNTVPPTGELRGDVPGRTSRPAQQPALSPAEIDAGQQIPSASAPPRVQPQVQVTPGRPELMMPPMEVQGQPPAPQVQVTPGQLQRVPLQMDPIQVAGLPPRPPKAQMDPLEVKGQP